MVSITILLLGYVLLALAWPLYCWFEVEPANMFLLASAVVNLIALVAVNKAIFKPEDEDKVPVPTLVYVLAIIQLIGITLIMGVDLWMLLHDHETARWIICATIGLPAFVYVCIRSAPLETRLMVGCLAGLICFSIFGTDEPFGFIKPNLVAVDEYLSSSIGVPFGFFRERGRAWLHLLVIPILYVLTD